MNLAEFLPLLDGLRQHGEQWDARCPGHEDDHQSLCISRGNDGRILLHCQAGCETECVIDRLGLKWSDLYPTNGNGHHAAGRQAYDYHDADGNVVYQVVRTPEKQFWQRRPDGAGGWINGRGKIKTVLYRLPDILKTDPEITIYVNEGEKHCDRLRALGLTATTNPGGACKWKPEYSEALRGRHVEIVEDNDEPGRKHAEQAATSLHGIAASIKILDLPGLPPKGDIIDWLDAGHAVEELVAIGETAPEWAPAVQRERPSEGAFEALKETIERYLLLADPHLITVVAGALVAHLFKSNPLWLLIVQPPSSAKTEILEGTTSIDIVHCLSDLTANTLLSGFDKKKSAKPGTEPSLLPKLDGRIIMMKDFGTVLSMHRDRRQEVLAQLREVFDGHLVKAWGNGKELDWRGHVGFIGGCTPAIDQHYSVMAMLGERFTLYRAAAADRKKVGARAISNLRQGGTRKMRADIRAAFKNWYTALKLIPLDEVACSTEQEQILATLADLTALVRTGVARDGYRRNILARPEHEGPARLVQQFLLLAAGVAVAKGRQSIIDDDIDIIRHVAISTMPGQRVDALRALQIAPPGIWTRTREIANTMRYPNMTTKEILEDLVALQLIEQDLPQAAREDDADTTRRDTRPYCWRLLDSTIDLIEDTGLDLGGRHEA